MKFFTNEYFDEVEYNLQKKNKTKKKNAAVKLYVIN